MTALLETEEINKHELSVDQSWSFRQPELVDGQSIHKLIANCPPLDENSSYCNFLQTGHFTKTCLMAEKDGVLAGFISGYRKPETPSTLFVWQVAVNPDFRGQGLAFQMLKQLLGQAHLHDISRVETTITKDNQGSWRLFEKLDKLHGQQGKVTTFLDQKKHFKGLHDTEYLYQIPLKPSH
ncbi:diaminobutyrate acetyltransferase [Vibrio sp. HB161653]|uniref:diaminobutyrate acetyltransferase n=1 Tax=Vibrio sp. HB161653 TaxID=3068274 RepID=UPI00353176F7